MGHTHKREQTATLGGEPMTAENTPDPAATDTIVLIHGLWVTPRSWEKWIEHCRGPHPRAVALRLRQHPLARGVRRGLRPLPRPRPGRARVGRRAGQLYPRPPGHLRELQERGTRALAVHSGRRRQPDAAR